MSWRTNRFFSRKKVNAPGTSLIQVGKTIEDLRKAMEGSPPSNPWEQTFINSISDYFRRNKGITPAQKATLEKIAAKYSPQAKEEEGNWASSFTSEMREKYLVACEYYSHSPYYGRAVNEWRIAVAEGKEKTLVPSKSNYRTLTENKYFLKIWAAWTEPAKFAVGDLVSLATASHARGLELDATLLVVTPNYRIPRSAAKGAKIYRLVVCSTGAIQTAEERYIRKVK
jgi:hypothetical protein